MLGVGAGSVFEFLSDSIVFLKSANRAPSLPSCRLHYSEAVLFSALALSISRSKESIEFACSIFSKNFK